MKIIKMKVTDCVVRMAIKIAFDAQIITLNITRRSF